MSSEKIKALLDENEKVAEAQEELSNAKIDFSMKALAILLTTLDDRIKELFSGMAETVHFDKALGDVLRQTISEAMQTFLQVKHEINFQPQINVDTGIKSEISRGIEQSKLLYALIEKMDKNGGKNELLYNLTLSMINKATASYERLMEGKDYTAQLNELTTAVNKGKATEWEATNIKRDSVGRIESFKIKTIK